jgi:hypothetical protein
MKMPPVCEAPAASRRASVPEAAAAVPPVLDPDRFERYEGLRETTLAAVTDPDFNRTLRRLVDTLYTMAVDYSRHWPSEPEGSFRHLARAGVADLRHLQGFLACLGRQGEVAEITPAEERIARKCRALATRVRDVANALEGELEQVAERPSEEE